jgi:archaellum component FlaC
MTKETIDQKPVIWQEEIKKLNKRIEHLTLLIGALRDELNALHASLPDAINNELRTKINKLERDKQAVAYLVGKQEDIEAQSKNKPLIIEEDKK